jgi:hypothetical protein
VAASRFIPSTIPGGTLDNTRLGLVGSAEIVGKVVLPPRR